MYAFPRAAWRRFHGAFPADNLAATLTLLQVDRVYQFGSGYARRRLLDESPQQYMHEVAVRHAT